MKIDDILGINDPEITLDTNWRTWGNIGLQMTLMNEFANLVGAEDIPLAKSPADLSDNYEHWMNSGDNIWIGIWANLRAKCEKNKNYDLSKDPLWK